MSNEEIFKKVNSILIELDIISEETDKDTDLFNECGLSSVSVIDIIVGLEETFDISLDSDDDMSETEHSIGVSIPAICFKVDVLFLAANKPEDNAISTADKNNFALICPGLSKK